MVPAQLSETMEVLATTLQFAIKNLQIFWLIQANFPP